MGMCLCIHRHMCVGVRVWAAGAGHLLQGCKVGLGGDPQTGAALPGEGSRVENPMWFWCLSLYGQSQPHVSVGPCWGG